MSFKALVISEVFPPQTGGSGKWLWEIYKRQPVGNFVMAVGDSLAAGEEELSYPHAIHRIDLSMKFRGIRSLDSLAAYTRQFRSLGKLVRAENVTVVHAARPLSEGLVAWALKQRYGIPYLCYVHGEDVAVATTSRELKLVTRPVLKGATKLIANSHFTAGMLRDEWGIDPQRVQVMHPGVDTSCFRPREIDEAGSRWPGRFVLLTVGRLQQRKGHDTVIRALPELLIKFPNLLYVIAGNGEERQRLQALAEQLGVLQQVEFLGEISDAALLDCFQQCDVFVLANREVGRDAEGFGIVLLEAQACGKPVIAGDSGGTRDTLRPSETGYLVDCQSCEALVNLLTGPMSDKAHRVEMGKLGRKHVVDNFDWASLAVEARRHFAAARDLPSERSKTTMGNNK
ncbi:glycosyltransferase family 4 protein [Rosistilla oblonga]|uniref:glycosyltransferase family 4 protein n=1 Tax=Rosistilla oblonga TaxID=2527990 RepID=UPI003A97CA0B